jgi:hypothetical protein
MNPNAMLVPLLLLATLLAAPAVPAPEAKAPPAPAADAATQIPNPAINMQGFLAASEAAAEHRRTRRVSEEEFLRMRAEPGTLVLDARSAQRYQQLHVRGAINLSFPDLTVESLAALVPDRNTRILIYCNNNFLGAPEPFPTKIASASLNLSTFIALYDYGYRNVYELGPLVDVRESRLPFEGSAVEALGLAEPAAQDG